MLLPYTRVQFAADGSPVDRQEFDAAVSMIGGGTDVLIISHGWNNDVAAAERLFTTLSDNIATQLAGRRDLSVIGVVWPSKQWSSPDNAATRTDDTGELSARIDDVVDNPDVARRLKELAGQLDDSPAARAEFVGALRVLLPPGDAVDDDDAPPDMLRSGEPDALFDKVQEAPADARLLDFLKNPVRAAQELLNVTTYYTMKARAGAVGTNGLPELLTAIRPARPAVRIHLAGHSFGARVVTAATANTNVPIASVSLLQGAFSDRAMADNPTGGFRGALTDGALTGPMIVTYTQNDVAVGLAYALASRLAGQSDSRLVGGAGDPYGGLGANGALCTPEAVPVDLGDQSTVYTFTTGKVHNLLGDKFISGHGDVTNPAVANAVLSAMMTA